MAAVQAPVAKTIDELDNTTAEAIYTALESQKDVGDDEPLIIATNDPNNNCVRAAAFNKSMIHIVVQSFSGSLSDDDTNAAVVKFRDSINPSIPIQFVECASA